MKVAHLVLTLDQGGLERLVMQMAEHRQRRGHPSVVVVLSRGALVDEARRRGIETVVLDKADGLDPGLCLRLVRLFRRHRIDVVHTHNLAPLVYGTIAARLAGLPTVNTRHGRAALRAHAALWSLTHRVIAVSEDARRELVRHNRIEDRKVGVIVNGIDLSSFQGGPSAAGIRTALRLAPDVPLVGTVGRLAVEKDQRTLLDAHARLRREGSRAHVIVAGSGRLEGPLRAAARELGIGSSVHFLGARSDVPAIMSGLDVFVLPSLMEGVSLTLIEAMASGLPVVATRVGGTPEVVVDGETGVLVPPADAASLASALGRLLADPTGARAMGARGRLRAEAHFSIERLVDAYEAVYDSLAPGRPSGRVAGVSRSAT